MNKESIIQKIQNRLDNTTVKETMKKLDEYRIEYTYTPNQKGSIIHEEMKEKYSHFPLVGDYDINPEIFEPEILELIKFSIEDED